MPLNEQLDEIVRMYQGLRADMKANGLHVGLGTPATCVSCQTPWPCERAR